ncbi:putative ferredoxin-like protein YdhY [bioreactor metagenome]|uniref:Fe-S-cluster-containing hydrogenase component 2 n=2 Tax=root TaxID=1 RepID=A0A1G9N7E5_9FIRM|nr:4Fe-4S binding protein [Romboutsia lituseburensis]CEH34162.1 4Fe-4S binding domain protein [Romboutsia lituseburensis]SDL82439.1 Fe-S-cluster-containing hydrogenase component 2 [Romboutsia lituseburensis DSM 797]
MKKLVVTDRSACQDCLSCEIACSQAFYKAYELNTSCIKIGHKKDDSIDVKACNQCGLCARKCPQEAITQNAKGVYMINKKKCNGCLTCVEACPKGIIANVEGKPVPSKCIACGICVDACPMGILQVQEG